MILSLLALPMLAGYTGDIVAFDVAGNAVVATLPMTAGIWIAGRGLIADEDGYLYAITGNGDFESFPATVDAHGIPDYEGVS
jgi:hypothetical protein